MKSDTALLCNKLHTEIQPGPEQSAGMPVIVKVFLALAFVFFGLTLGISLFWSAVLVKGVINVA